MKYCNVLHIREREKTSSLLQSLAWRNPEKDPVLELCCEGGACINTCCAQEEGVNEKKRRSWGNARLRVSDLCPVRHKMPSEIHPLWLQLPTAPTELLQTDSNGKYLKLAKGVVGQI